MKEIIRRRFMNLQILIIWQLSSRQWGVLYKRGFCIHSHQEEKCHFEKVQIVLVLQKEII